MREGVSLRYQELFAPFVYAKQKAALRFSRVFAPKSSFTLFVRNQILNLLRMHWFANLILARDLRDNLALPEYRSLRVSFERLVAWIADRNESRRLVVPQHQNAAEQAFIRREPQDRLRYFVE